MSEITKGPWASNGTRVESESEHGWANDGWIICDCEGSDAEANACLIAAAPELLEVAAMLIARGIADRTVMEKARAALAKASGAQS